MTATTREHEDHQREGDDEVGDAHDDESDAAPEVAGESAHEDQAEHERAHTS